MIPGRRLLWALVAAMLGASLLLPTAAAQLPGECPEVVGRGQWSTIPAPDFASGGAELIDHAVDPMNPLLIYATNGAEVWRSGDAGCSWERVFRDRGSDLPIAGDYSITHVEAPGQSSVVLLAQASGGPRVVVSRARGEEESWQDGGAGLPPVGEARFLAASPVNPNFMFVGIGAAGDVIDALFASTDGGATFTLRSDVGVARGISGVTVDPGDPDTLWAYGPGGLYGSSDGGRSFQRHQQFEGEPVGAVTVTRGGGPAQVFVFTDRAGYLSQDGGDRFFKLEVPGGADAAARGAEAHDVAVSAGGEVFGFDRVFRRFQNIGCPNPDCSDVVATRSAPSNYFARTVKTIERYQVPVTGGIFDYGIDVPPLQERPEDVAGDASLSPAARRIVLKPGEIKKVRYRLGLPKVPVPIDVYFVLDTSGTMAEPLAGIARSFAAIVQRLEDEGVDARFGIAEFRGYPDSPTPRSNEPSFVYRQLGDIGTPLSELETILESLEADAGGQYDSHLAALYQTATGEGQDVHPVGVPNEGDVPPGLEAAFRSISRGLRVVVMASDEAFGRVGQDPTDFINSPAVEGPPPDIPTFDEVAAAMNERDIRHVGIAIGNLPSVREDMARISTLTGSVATSPTDCNSDGAPDIAPGGALVCHVPTNDSDQAALMAPMIVDLLKQLQERSQVDLVVRRGREAVADVSAGHDDVVLQTAARLGFRVTYRCRESMAGERFRVELGGELNGKRIRGPEAQAVVVCKETPEDEIVPAEVLPLVALPLVPGAPPPPAPVTNAQTVSQSQPSAQGAAAAQRQEEPQLAFVAAEDGLQEEELYAMSSYDRRDVPAEALLGAGAVAVSLMFAAGLALRRRLETVRETRR